MHLFWFLFCCHLSHIRGAEIAQGQDEPAQRFLRQGGKPGTLVRNFGRAEDDAPSCVTASPPQPLKIPTTIPIANNMLIVLFIKYPLFLF